MASQVKRRGLVHRCTQCAFQGDKPMMTNHWAVKHSEEPPFQCGECGGAYIKEHDARNHISKKHPGAILKRSLQTFQLEETHFKLLSEAESEKHYAAGKRQASDAALPGSKRKKTEDQPEIQIHITEEERQMMEELLIGRPPPVSPPKSPKKKTVRPLQPAQESRNQPNKENNPPGDSGELPTAQKPAGPPSDVTPPWAKELCHHMAELSANILDLKHQMHLLTNKNEKVCSNASGLSATLNAFKDTKEEALINQQGLGDQLKSLGDTFRMAIEELKTSRRQPEGGSPPMSAPAAPPQEPIDRPARRDTGRNPPTHWRDQPEDTLVRPPPRPYSPYFDRLPLPPPQFEYPRYDRNQDTSFRRDWYRP